MNNKTNDTLLKKQILLNKKLTYILLKDNINELRLTTLGNSISSGYSMIFDTCPLMYRNTSLAPIMESNNIKICTPHFARAQNNESEKIYDWFRTNIKLADIYSLNKIDYTDGPFSIPTTLTSEDISKYYSKNEDLRLKDFTLENKNNLANIIVLNAGTGSIINTAFKTTGKCKFFSFLKDNDSDFFALNSLLKDINDSNREKNSKTQVYLNAIPDYLGVKATSLLNNKLRKLCNKYPNVVFVEPIYGEFFYNMSEHKALIPHPSDIQVDLHFSNMAYNKLNNKILQSITENYNAINKIIELDRELIQIAKIRESMNNNNFNKTYINAEDHCLKKHNQTESKLTKQEFITYNKKYKTLFKNLYPNDYYLAFKDNAQINLYNKVKEYK